MLRSIYRVFILAAFSLVMLGCSGNSDPVEGKEPAQTGEETADAASSETSDAVGSLSTASGKSTAEPSSKPSSKPSDTVGGEASATGGLSAAPPFESSTPPSPGFDLAFSKERESLFVDLVAERPGARDAALGKLQLLGGDALRDAAVLLRTSPDSQTRLGAAFYLLDRFNESDETQRQALGAALKDSEAAIRNIALQLALRSETTTVEHLSTIAGLMNDSTAAASSRIKAIRGMAKMPERAATVLTQIRDAASSAPEPSVRSAAVFTLSRVDLGADGVAAIADRLQNDQASEVRKLAAARLGRMEPALATPALSAGLEDADAAVRQSVADSLGRMGQPAIAPLIRKLGSESAEVRRLAVYALGKNGAAAANAIPALQNLAEKDGDAEVRNLAKLTVRIISSDDARR